MIQQDNSQLRHQVQNCFEQGQLKWNKGQTKQLKEEGISLMIQGLKKLETWILRENDQAMKENLQKNLQTKYKEVQDILEEFKKMQGQDSDRPNSSRKGDQIMAKKGEKKQDEDNDKLKQSLNEAIVSENPHVQWDDISGLQSAKKALQEAVILPIKFPNLFVGVRKPWSGILLYGPPGTGKTFLAKACATEAQGTFFSISSSDLISKYVGESEKLIKTLFQLARDKKPSIIFIDEIDSLAGNRSDGENEASRRVKTEILVQMQGVGNDNKGVLVLGATNLPWALDPAVRRRLEKRIYIPLPESDARQNMIKNSLKNTENDLTENDLFELGEKTEMFSGSDISILVRDACFQQVRLIQEAEYFQKFYDNGKEKFKPVLECNKNEPGVQKMNLYEIPQDKLYVPKVQKNDFLKSLERTKPSVGKEQLKEYEKFTSEFGQDGD